MPLVTSIDEARDGEIVRSFLETGKTLWFDKPYIVHPFLNYVFLAASTTVFGLNTLGLTMVSMVAGALIVFLVYLLGKEVLNPKAGIIMALLMALQPLFWFYSDRALNNVPSTLFFVLAIYLFVKFIKTKDPNFIYLTSFIAGIACLTRFASGIIFVIIGVYLLFDKDTREAILHNKLQVMLGILALIGMSLALFGYNYYVSGQIFDTATYFDVGFVTSFDAEPWWFYLAMFVPYVRMSLVVLFILGVIVAFGPKKGHGFGISKVNLFLLLAFVLTFIEISIVKVKTDRYLIPLLPFIAVFAGYGLAQLTKVVARHQKHIAYITLGIVMLWVIGAFYLEGSQMIVGLSAGFCGFEQAGKWVDQNTYLNDSIYAGSYGTIGFYADRDNLNPIPVNKSELDSLIFEGKVDYIILDIWERTQPSYIFEYVYNNSRVRPVDAVMDPTNVTMPLVIFYEVNSSALQKG